MTIVVAVLFFECVNFYGNIMWKIVIKVFTYLSLFYVIVNDLLMLVLPGIFRASDELGTGDKFNCFFLGNKFNVVYGYIATWCTENYARLMLLWLRRNDYRSAANCWKQMMKFQQRFADDEDILKAIAGAADALYDIYRENQVPGRRRKLLKDMERIFDETHNADVANALAILEANEHTIYDPPAVFDSNKSEILLSTENKLKEIYEAFPNEGKVVLGYSYLVSWNYVTWLDFPRPIDEELIPLFKKWIRKFPENKLELMEYYSFILFEKWLYMDSLDNISEANKIYYEIKAIADELSKDYADNQVTQMLSMGIVRKL